MLTRKIEIYDFSKLALVPLSDAEFLNEPFYLLVPELPSFETDTLLLSVPGALELRMVNRSYDDDLPEIESMRGECCFYFRKENEWILDAAFTMVNNLTAFRETYHLRLPMSAPFAQSGRIGLYFDGVWLRFIKDGEVLNENKGNDRFVPDGGLTLDASLSGTLVARATDVPMSYRDQDEPGNADFYMPHGWNAFAGDVMNFYHDGTYHLLYLLDRRHHMSWNGKGAHYIAQLTSQNLIDWQEQELVIPIQHTWESIGTGTLIHHNGTYYMSYGVCSERYIRTQDADNPFWKRMQLSDFNQDVSACTEVPYETILAQGNIPRGSSYAVSKDGIHFTPSNKLYHAGTNPSIYTNEQGGLTLWCGLCPDERQNGVWESPGMGQPFVRSAENWDCLRNTPIPFSTECPSLFRWNGHQYLLVGWCGYFRTKTPGGELFDAVAAGENVYDGLGVPMVCDYKDGRKLIAGWIRHIGWGSVIIHRELIQDADGKLSMKWLPEMLPRTTGSNLLTSTDLNQNTAALETDKSYLISMQINPGTARRMGVVFESEDGRACELQLDFEKQRVQMNDAPADRLAESLPALYEMADQFEGKQCGHLWNLENIPQKSINFCLPDIPGMDTPFTLRILCRSSRKLDSTVIDAEIAGRRTIVSGRPQFFPNKLRVRWDGEGAILSAAMEELADPVQ